MDKIKCIITDDEPFARKGLQGYAAQVDFLELRGVCENAVELNSLLKRESVDLLFLDIEMPYMTGIDFLKHFQGAPKVVFTTAYEKYALQGFELEVLDYLIKPIPFERFLRAANKAYDYFRAQAGVVSGAGPGSGVAPGTAVASGAADYFFVKADSKLEKIAFADILFAEALENYVAIYTREKKVITHLTLKMLQEKLPAAAFVQPHKSYVIAVDKINSIEGNIVHIDRYQVPISKYQREEIMERIVNSKLLKR